MGPSEFFIFLKQWRDLNKLPTFNSWPKYVHFGGDMWGGIKKLYEYTASNNFEYETSFFFVEGDVFNTPPFKGEKDKVSARHDFSVKYVPKSGEYYEKQVIMDDKVVKKEAVKAKNLPKEIRLGYLFNVHSHPVHKIMTRSGEVETYGFFSGTDINSLLYGSAVISGLVTDEFWLVAKTDRTISQIGEVGMEMLQRVSNQAYSGDKYLEDVIRKEMVNWGLVFYRARFGQTLTRII